MYRSHPVFVEPHDEEIKVWRYLDFTKLVSLIDTRRLFFARADKLNDPFEGSLPKSTVESRNLMPSGMPEEFWKYYMEVMKKRPNINQQWPRYVAINCWHANEYESAAMWRIYLKSDEGIAIQTTYKRFKESIVDNEDVYIGSVRYIDYEKENIIEGNILNPFVYKRKALNMKGKLGRW